MKNTRLEKEIFEQGRSFDSLAMEVFQFQAVHVKLYHKYLEYLDINPASVKKVEQIPFLPVEFFKGYKILADGHEPGLFFESSGTSGMELSRHYLAEEKIYQKAILQGFNAVYGSPADYNFLCLLPSYSEREHSSLVYMMDYLMEAGGNSKTDWYLHNHEDLNKRIIELQNSPKKIFLLGVTFALLDFAEKYRPDLSKAIVMETGGMKGRRNEMIREEVHNILKQNLKLCDVHSEYGMTEMLSQAYAERAGVFTTAPTMQIYIRDPNDPFELLPKGQAGGINVIDLANLYSCSFLELKDLGRKIDDTHFEVLGRFDNSDIRGCSLLYTR